METLDNLVLSFDVGTQSLRAGIVNKKGQIIYLEQRKYEKAYFSSKENYAEQDANFYWQELCQASRDLHAKAGPIIWQNIRAVTITTFRDSVLCLDENFRPLRPLILWLDKRESEKYPSLKIWQSLAFLISGMYSTSLMLRKRCACNWLMYNEEEIWQKTKHFVMQSAYFNYLLTGQLVDCNANVIGHMPIDFKNKRWHKEGSLKHSIFPVPTEKLCKLCEPGTIIGQITKKASDESLIPCGLDLIATGSDKGCESIGFGCIDPNSASLSFGTSATVQITIPKYKEPQRFFPSYPSPYKNHYSAEIQIYRGYWLITWFKKEFASLEIEKAKNLGISVEELLNSRLGEIAPGCDGLIFQPYFTPGVESPHAKGSLIGFFDKHTKMHFYRSIIEGINFALLDGLRSMEKRLGTRVKEIYLGGGGSKSKEICQITADMFGLPVKRVQTSELALLGSSMLAFVTLGIYKNLEEAKAEMVHLKDVFLPNRKNHKLYKELYKDVFRQIFSRLGPLYKHTKSILNSWKKKRMKYETND